MSTSGWAGGGWPRRAGRGSRRADGGRAGASHGDARNFACLGRAPSSTSLWETRSQVGRDGINASQGIPRRMVSFARCRGQTTSMWSQMNLMGIDTTPLSGVVSAAISSSAVTGPSQRPAGARS